MNETQATKIREIISAIREGEHFLIATHVRPDGDAIGSLLGMKLMLQHMGKCASACAQDKFPPEFEFLPGCGEVRSRPNSSLAYDAAILVDCGDIDRVGTELAAFITGSVPVIINIDHHTTHSPFGTIHWIETSASSTCEMLFEICLHLSLPLDSDLASLLYVGMLTDTGSFRFSNTNKHVFEMASTLVNAGADPAYIAQQIYDSATPERLNLLTQVLSTMEFHADSRIASAELTRDMLARTGTTYMDSEGFINHLRSVKSVDMAIIFREGSDGLIHISLRSKSGVDVARFAQRYGGGGHRQAAACRISGNLDAVRSMIVSEAANYIG